MNKIEEKIYELLKEVDHYLEEEYENKYRLHPARPDRGETSNPTRDGLINMTARFSAGYGSELGRGYVVDIKLKTLEDVDDETIENINQVAKDIIKEKLPEYFPDRDLSIGRDGNIFKIYGDFSRGEI